MPLVSDWNEADRALEALGALDLEIGGLSSDLGRKLHELVREYSPRLADLSGRRRAVQAAVESFCLLNKSEFAARRSRQLPFGRIAFRMSERIDVPREFEQAAIATLKKLGCFDCIEVRERLDKNSLKKLSDADLARCGIRRTREDHFRIEPDLNAIAKRLGGRDPVSPAFAVDVEKLAQLVRRAETEEAGGC